MIMTWSLYLACISVVFVNAINRPVYKIVLTQKGYAQFLQYDVETPPLREFTLCTWIRVYDLANDQSIFTYVAHGNNRVVRLWLEAGGRFMMLSINGKITSKFDVDFVKDVWRHACLSYQSDYGAWALYVDSRLASCEAAHSLYGYIIPGGGSVIVGYGTADDGSPNGFEGEIFGTNMILSSTIERNYTMRKDSIFEQKLPKKKGMKERKNLNNYIVLGDLQTDEIHNTFEKTYVPAVNTTRSYIKFQTPFSLIEHDVGGRMSSRKPKRIENSEEMEILDYTVPDKFRTTENEKIDFRNLLNLMGSTGSFNIQTKPKSEKSSTKEFYSVSEYETPPPEISPSIYFDVSRENNQETFIETKHKSNKRPIIRGNDVLSTKPFSVLSEVETPPPIHKDTQVYGQWTSSKYAGSVLNYLKSINFQNREKNIKSIPPTIPLSKISDAYPYASDFKISKLLPPPPEFKRRNIIGKRNDMIKKYPQINVQILENNIRSNIHKMHAQTRPKQVEITSRGEVKKQNDHRFYRNAFYDSTENPASIENVYKTRPLRNTDTKQNEPFETNNLKYKSVLPFLKSLEYLLTDSANTKLQNSDIYSKSLANGNKWHNVKSYNNDYTPRRINMELGEVVNTHNKKHPSIRLKYKHAKDAIQQDDDPTIVKGRQLADNVSNQSENNKSSISLLTYNHGYLPTQNNEANVRPDIKTDYHRKKHENNFNKHVKIGNALNERQVLGSNEEQKKQSFVGGLMNIPDINRYRSDIDNEYENVPSSLSPRICKKVVALDRDLYVQQDGSIDITHIMSPLRQKNLAVEFILDNYKKCSLSESLFERNFILFIHWIKTPVRLFGGAFPKKTTDLCGFF